MRDKISILGMIAGGGFLISGDRTTIVIQAAEKSDCKFPSNWKSSPVDIVNVGKVGSPRMGVLAPYMFYAGPMLGLGPCWVCWVSEACWAMLGLC